MGRGCPGEARYLAPQSSRCLARDGTDLGARTAGTEVEVQDNSVSWRRPCAGGPPGPGGTAGVRSGVPRGRYTLGGGAAGNPGSIV